MDSKTKAGAQAIGLDVAWVFLAPWFVILAAGDLHRFSPVPLLGYWQVFWPVTLLVSIADGIATRHRYYGRAGR